jgi:hypothetical protein
LRTPNGQGGGKATLGGIIIHPASRSGSITLQLLLQQATPEGFIHIAAGVEFTLFGVKLRLFVFVNSNKRIEFLSSGMRISYTDNGLHKN